MIGPPRRSFQPAGWNADMRIAGKGSNGRVFSSCFGCRFMASETARRREGLRIDDEALFAEEYR